MTNEHRQIHRPSTGDSECSCGEWEGPMTVLTEDDPRSFENHLRGRSS